MAIQPSDVQYGFTKCRGRVVVGRVYDDGFLYLEDDPGVWIQSNPDSLSSVRSLELYLSFYKGERIGDSIGELSQLTHLFINEGWRLTCLPNTLSRLHHLHHLELSPCDSLEDLPPNFGGLYNLTYLCLRRCDSLNLIESVAKLSNLTTLVISELKELPPNLGGLYNLKSLTLDDCENYVIQSVTKLSNLTTLIISFDDYYEQLEELPANLGDLKFLASLFLDRCYRLRCLPWSITKLSYLRFLYLHEEFRLETLPPHLNDSIIISVVDTHIRKTWKELKTQITEFPIITEELTAQKTSTPGYLHFIGDPTLWIRDYNNYGLLSSLRVLDLEEWSCKGKIPDSIGELLPQLTHLYISKGCLPHHLPPTFSRLTHLSLIHCTFECHTISHFDSLGNLSTLTSLHLYQRYNKLLPEHMDLPMSLTHLTLQCCYSSIPDSFVASMVGKLSNLNTLTLSACRDLESLPLHLNLTKLILRNTTIKSLPIGLKHLEIIHVICRGEYCNKLQECWRNQLVNLETLSFTCYRIKSLSSVTSLHNLRELQLKDCFNLRELPPDLDKLVNLYTLDVSGTRIHSLPDSIINLHNLQHLILPKCFIPKRFPCDFENKVTISVDDTDESYYKYVGYYDSVYKTSNNNPNAFISSPNQEIENLPTSNEHGTIDVDDFLLSEENYAVDENNSPAVSNSQNQETEIWQSNNQDGVVTDKAAEPSSNNLHETNSVGLSNQQVFRNERIANILELEQGTSSSGSLKAQDNNSQRVDVQHKTQKIRDNISLERINELKSQDHLTLEAAAEHLHVSRSTLKRRLKELDITWSSSKKKKNPDKNRNETHSTCERNLSQLNSIDASNPASHGQGVENLAGSSQSTLSSHVPSAHNVVNNSTPDVVTTTVGEPPLSTQYCMDSHQHVEEHPNDGVREPALVNTDLPPNERCSTFVVKATFNEDTARFNFSLSSSIEKLKEEVGKSLDLEVDTFKIRYLDDEKEWMLMNRISDLELALNLSRASGSNVVRLSISLKT